MELKLCPKCEKPYMESEEVCPRCPAAYSWNQESWANLGCLLLMFVPLVIVIFLWFFFFLGIFIG